MELADVAAHARRLGPIVHLATVSPAGHPHVVPVHVDWHIDHMICMAGVDDAKTRNIEAHPAVCLHHQVGESTGWDSLIVWATARILRSAGEKRRLWSGVLAYDLDEFAPGGPDASPETCFVEMEPRSAVLLRRYGFDGREEWRAS